MPAKIGYFVMFERDIEPQRVVVSSWLELVEALTRMVAQRGPIDWMQRDYNV